MSKNIYTSQAKAAKKAASNTPQTQVIPGRESDMKTNNAGGVSFIIDEWEYLDRFLILGSDANSYYASAQKLTKDASSNAIKAIENDGVRAVNRIVEISTGGRAPKNDPAVFALALAAMSSNKETSSVAYSNLSKVCRTGTHLFQFVDAINSMGKWNAMAKRGIASWYNRNPDRLAVQVVKYAQRDGWSHRDVLRLAHVKPTQELDGLFHWIVKQGEHKDGASLPKLISDVERLRAVTHENDAVKIILENKDITWEMMPTQFQKSPKVWSALLPNMGLTALIRKLGQLTAHGVIEPLGSYTKIVIEKIEDSEAIKAQRVHPISLLMALRQYSVGHGNKGSLSWKPNQRIITALDDAFYSAFNYVEPTGTDYVLGLDISGSMFGGSVSGAPNLYPAEVSACMALAVAKTEKNYEMFGFDTNVKSLNINSSMSLNDVLNSMQNLRWSGGGTDCSLPMKWALDKKIKNVGAFCVYTDNETWAGDRQPVQVLNEYRNKYNKDAKLIVCATSVTNFSIADPKDRGMMDIVGFDSAAPSLISEFIRKQL